MVYTSVMGNPPKSRLVDTPEGLREVRKFLENNHVIGLDVETNVVDRFTERYIRTIQVSSKEQSFVIDLLAFCPGGLPELVAQQTQFGRPLTTLAQIRDIFQPILDSRDHIKVGHRLNFEYMCFRWCMGIYMWHLYDTYLCERIIRCGEVPFHNAAYWSLKEIALRTLKLDLSKTEQLSFGGDGPLRGEQVQYAAMDAWVVLAIRDEQKKLLEKNKLNPTALVEFDAIPAFGELELNGIRLDADKWLEALKTAQEEQKKVVETLDTFFIPVVGVASIPPLERVEMMDKEWRAFLGVENKTRRLELREAWRAARREYRQALKDMATYEGKAAINYGAVQQLKDALERMGHKLLNTNDETLRRMDHVPVIKVVRQYREWRKLLTSYGPEYLKHINPTTGRIHPSYNQLGAETGRSSTASPNIQQVPALKAFRRAFGPDPGNLLCMCDMSSAELRIIADRSNSPIWLEALKAKKDLHSICTESIRESEWRAAAREGCEYYLDGRNLKCKCPGHMALREATKTLNFLLAYGGGSGKLAAAVGISKDEAQDIMDAHEAKFEEIWRYLKESGDTARRGGCAFSAIGRRRILKSPSQQDIVRTARQKAYAEGNRDKWDENKPICRGSKWVPFRDWAIGRQKWSMFGAIERAGRNMPIQGTNADIAKRAMGCGFDHEGKPYLWHVFRKLNAKMVLFVHDEIDSEAAPAVIDDVREAVVDAIRRAGAEQLTHIEMEAETHVAECWEK